MLHTHEGSHYRAQISISTIYAHVEVSTIGLAKKSDLCRSSLASTTLMSRQMKALSIDSKVGNILAKDIAIRKAWCCIRNVSCVWFVC